MNSKHTKDSKHNEQTMQDWMPDGWKDKNETLGTGNNEIIPENRKETTLTSLPQPETAMPKRTGSKQRKESLEQYRQIFLQVPKLEDRKPVFVSREVRDRLDEIVRRLGGRKMSVSGFVENLARYHLESYQEDVENWKKL